MSFGNNGRGALAGDAYLGNLINNDTGRELLMSAIQGNGNAINQLASTLNCDINSVKSAINGVMSQIQGVGNQVGMSSQQIINAVQAGNCQIASQIAKCCCDNQLAICQQTNTLQNAINGVNVGQERGFANVAYETQRQTCDLRDSKSIVDSVPYHNNVISACEGILKDLNPRFAKEKERDEDISNLKTKIGGIETKMDRILTLLSKGETK